jgi:hypothetical protein
MTRATNVTLLHYTADTHTVLTIDTD